MFTEDSLYCALVKKLIPEETYQNKLNFTPIKRDVSSYRIPIIAVGVINLPVSILETEKFLYPMRKSDCEKVTSQFFATLRRAWEEGNLYIKGRDDELYV